MVKIWDKSSWRNKTRHQMPDYHDKKNPSKRWVVYASGFGPESLPTHFHNWLHNTSDEISTFDLEESNQESLVKRRLQKHTPKHKNTRHKGYNSWQPK